MNDLDNTKENLIDDTLAEQRLIADAEAAIGEQGLFGTRHGYEFKLKIHERPFEGPLDLLLALIREAKIDIKDIFVSEITNQYIEYVSHMDTFELDYVSEFIEMAATLLEIKSKKLLPKIEKEKTNEEVHDESWLIRQLQEYKLFKETA
ncbi:MAG: segregation/condensation protein A, partial [Clostridiales bacterium]|nr:segregation/condensation protein A [Clostridiales bacterium]